MTGPEMNGHLTKKISLRWAGILVPVSALSLCACASAFDSSGGPPEAQVQVQVHADANRSYPRWVDFPRPGSDVPEPASIAGQVGTLQASDRRLREDVAEIDWALGDPAAFERDVRTRLSQIRLSTEAPPSDAEIEALAERLRLRAKAPPPIGRTP